MAGNKNSGRVHHDRPFRDALVLELELAAKDKSKLRRVAKSLVKKAIDGDIQAMKEVADRVDGKAAQSLTVAGDQDNPLQFEYIERRIVKPK